MSIRRSFNSEKRNHQEKMIRGLIEQYVGDPKFTFYTLNGNTDDVRDNEHVCLVQMCDVLPQNQMMIWFDDPTSQIQARSVSSTTNLGMRRCMRSSAAGMAGWTKFFVKQYGKKYLPLHHAGAYQDPKTIATIVGAFLHRKYVDRRHRLIVDVDLCSTISETTGAQIVTGLLGPQCYGDLYIPAEAITAITVSARTNEKGKLRDPWTCYDEIEAVVKSVRPDAIRVWQDSYKGGTNGSNHGQPMHVAAFLVGRLKGK